MPRRSKKQLTRLQGDGFFDTIASWGRSVLNAYTPKLIADKPPVYSAPDPTPAPLNSGLPDKAILKDIADNSYKGTSDEMKDIPGFTLKLKTPTLVIYQSDTENVMVIGVRGTADFRDFKAWFSTAFNVIPDSARFKEDLQEIRDFQAKYPTSTFTYYATGHSLGGTLIDELIKNGMVKEARTYNPAIETSDIPDVALSQKNHRIYADGDPLYLLQGRFDNPTEVRKSYKYYPSSVMDFVPGYDKYKQHVLANPVFVGGEVPEYDKLKWGSFTKQFNAYNRKNPKNELKNLKEFAQMVVANPDKFAKTTEKRARFYLNVILKGGAKQVEMKPADYYAEHRNIVSLLDKTGKALQQEAQDQRQEAMSTAKRLGHANPFYHLRGAGIMANSQFYRTDPKRLGLKGDGSSQSIFHQGSVAPEPQPAPAAPAAPAPAQPQIQVEGRIEQVPVVGQPVPPYVAGNVDESDFRIMKRLLYMADAEGGGPMIREFRTKKYGSEEDRIKFQSRDYGGALIGVISLIVSNAGIEPNLLNGFWRREPTARYFWDTACVMLSQLPNARDRTGILDEMAERICVWMESEYGIARTREFLGRLSGGLSGRGILDDIKEGFKKGIESKIGKLPEPARLSPEELADARRRQRIQDIDKERANYVARKKQVAVDDLMKNAQYPNVLKALYGQQGTDNSKDYLQRIVDKATQAAERMYPY